MNGALNIHVTGIVQGVGFRPFVYRQAKHYLMSGWVLNSADGVHIHAEGDEQLLDEFCLSLANDAPAAAKVEQVEMQEVPLEDFTSFEIRHSQDEKLSKAGKAAGTTLVSPDLATCEDCVKELFDQQDRRYRYPFINCTNCGPRFTIISELPYDRSLTSMAKFKMCSTCATEYKDPLDRRFHAQPDACFECGPHVSWVKTDVLEDGTRVVDETKIDWGSDLKKSDVIFAEAVKMLLDGKIIAIKGLGGFHLACDASNEQAVAELRKRKERSNKAFAIMAASMDAVEQVCEVNAAEKNLLISACRPIVLLRRKYVNSCAQNGYVNQTAQAPSQLIAPSTINGLPEIGVMLPYTPVQHILLHDFAQAEGHFLVMTSGNIYDNPILTKDKEAYEVLADVADAFFGNNREILTRYDDSVVRVINAAGTEAVQFVRRARGYSPAPIKLHVEDAKKTRRIFATGPEQKNTFCFVRPIVDTTADSKYNAEVFVSQHVGDMENAQVYNAWLETKNRFEHVFKEGAKEIVCDDHPEYLTTKWAKELFVKEQVSNEPPSDKYKVSSVQHHFAHIASVMVENRLSGPVAGFAFDGTGYGKDGQIWGGEVMLCNTQDFERFANFSYVPMPGGAAAVKNPLRMAYGTLWAYDLLEHQACEQVFKCLLSDEKQNMNTMIENGLNTPYTSSVGRLFDAASAILGICAHPTYEGESAIMLEAAVHDWLNKNPDKACENTEIKKRYEIQITKNLGTKNSTAHDTSVVLFDAQKTFEAVLDDLSAGVNPEKIAKNFHDAFVGAIVNCANIIRQIYGINEVALSGGVFMNRYLIEKVTAQLAKTGFTVALNKEIPPNDGGVSLGQAAVCLNKA